jgi:hypothetical protein
MVSRTVAVVLLLCVAIALPVAAHAGQCQSVVVFVQSVDDVLDFTNLNPALRTISVVFYRNNGDRLGSHSVSLRARERRHMPARDLLPFGADFNDLYLRISSWVDYPVSTARGLFSAAVTHDQVVREPGCVTAPATPYS